MPWLILDVIPFVWFHMRARARVAYVLNLPCYSSIICLQMDLNCNTFNADEI